jgi:hypothetical protein
LPAFCASAVDLSREVADEKMLAEAGEPYIFRAPAGGADNARLTARRRAKCAASCRSKAAADRVASRGGDGGRRFNDGAEDHAMPLRAHFRPPLDDIASWEGLHGQWPGMMVTDLRRKLPPS